MQWYSAFLLRLPAQPFVAASDSSGWLMPIVQALTKGSLLIICFEEEVSWTFALSLFVCVAPGSVVCRRQPITLTCPVYSHNYSNIRLISEVYWCGSQKASISISKCVVGSALTYTPLHGIICPI